MVRVRLFFSERSSCFWVITWKKCLWEVCSLSERLKWKFSFRVFEDRSGVGFRRFMLAFYF